MKCGSRLNGRSRWLQLREKIALEGTHEKLAGEPAKNLTELARAAIESGHPVTVLPPGKKRGRTRVTNSGFCAGGRLAGRA